MALLAFRLVGEFYVPSRWPLISGSNLPKFSGNHCVRRDALTNRAPHPHHISRRVQSCAFKESRRSPDQKALPDEEPKDLGVRVALSMLRFYKREISPLLPSSCRYVPTCSEYSMEAYKKYGVAKGTVLTAWRLCRCNPLGGSGFDPPRWFGEENQHEDFLD